MMKTVKNIYIGAAAHQSRMEFDICAPPNRTWCMKRLLLTAFALLSTASVLAQLAIPPADATPFKDTSMLKPPPHAQVAIIEFEDLECGYCARYAPMVRAAAAKYNVPLVHRDFIIQSHRWSRTAAIDARYLEDKVSPRVAEDFRRDVFASQQLIASKDDLDNFSRHWFEAHGHPMPFVIDPACAAEVQADCVLGARLGVMHTPTIIVVISKQWIEVTDPNQLYAALDLAKSGVDACHSRSAGTTRK